MTPQASSAEAASGNPRALRSARVSADGISRASLSSRRENLTSRAHPFPGAIAPPSGFVRFSGQETESARSNAQRGRHRPHSRLASFIEPWNRKALAPCPPCPPWLASVEPSLPRSIDYGLLPNLQCAQVRSLSTESISDRRQLDAAIDCRRSCLQPEVEFLRLIQPLDLRHVLLIQLRHVREDRVVEQHTV